jgi:hypothetical protein
MSVHESTKNTGGRRQAPKKQAPQKQAPQKQEQGGRADLDAFLRERNIDRYRELLDSSTNQAERQTIAKLLAEEMEQRAGHHHRATADRQPR